MRWNLCVAVLIVSLAAPCASAVAGPYNFKLFGPFISAPLNLGRDAKGNDTVYRGVIVALDEQGKSAVVYDTDTMRMAAAWNDGGVNFDGLPFTGGHGAYPKHQGELVFHLQAGPGWAKGETLADPREGEYPPLGPLPHEWAHYRGLYVHGSQVVMRGRVGKSEVLETPSLAESDKGPITVRSLSIERDGSPMTLALADAPEKTAIAEHVATLGADGKVSVVGIGGAPQGATLAVIDGKLVLQLPAAGGTTRFDVRYWRGAAGDAASLGGALTAKAEVDFEKLTHGGPRRWTDSIETAGELSSDDKAAYVIDRITVPYSNPYGSPMRIGGFDFFADGTSLAASTWDGEVWIVSGVDDKLEKLTWKRYAAGLHESLGLKIVDGVIYALADDQITRFHDLNNDGEADYYENFNNDWELTSGFHAFCFDLHTDPAGNFYFAFGSPVRGGGRSFERMGRHHGSILRVAKDGSHLEIYASGLRAPNGMCVSPSGQVTSGDNEGTFVPRCPIHWISPGEFLGVVDSYEHYERLETTPTVAQRRGDRKEFLNPAEAPLPLAWLPKNVDNSGGGQAWVVSDRWGPLQGKMLHMSYGQSSLYLVMAEPKGDLMQGGVTKFPLRFTSSAMRARFNARDGQLYVSGLRGWQTNAATNGGIDRVRFTGRPVYMPKELRVKKNGVEIEFTCPLVPGSAADPDNYAVKGSDVRWTHDYGSGDYAAGQRDIDPSKWKAGSTEFFVDDAKLLSDGKTVFLTIADLQPVHQMNIKINVEAADGTPVKTDIWNTIHIVD